MVGYLNLQFKVIDTNFAYGMNELRKYFQRICTFIHAFINYWKNTFNIHSQLYFSILLQHIYFKIKDGIIFLSFVDNETVMYN